MNRTRLRAAVLVGVLVLASLPATTAIAQTMKRLKFVVITHATAVPFFVPVRKGAEDAGKLLGADVTYTGPAGFDLQRQVEFMKAAIARRGGRDCLHTTRPHGVQRRCA